ncbi:MAG: FAD:protein FMN transferase [Burkholderiales bacterium]|jgi:thiamine biosynthesis lipoprotein|nr:FAD:protein FMN transferase [Burkholderiales bacterium]
MIHPIRPFCISIGLLLCAVTGCGEKAYVQIDGQTMGTDYIIKYEGGVKETTAHIEEGVERQLEIIDALMSTYRSDSEISRFNASRAVHEPFPVSFETAVVVAESKRIHALTEGGFDITVAPLVMLWGFGANGREMRIPDEEEIAEQRGKTGMDNLSIVSQGNGGYALIKKIPELAIDLSAIAKGYAVDRVAAVLDAQDIHNYMVEIGGEVRARGKNERGETWRIGIEHPSPNNDKNILEVVILKDEALATSGNYRHYFEQGGRRYSHTIDPRTGAPVRDELVSVSIVAPLCMRADALATGLSALSLKDALRIADSLNIPVLIAEEGPELELYFSKAFLERRK